MTPEEEEFEIAVRDQLKSQEEVGDWNKWLEMYWTRSWKFPLTLQNTAVDLVVFISE
jgi:hypothetical protein